MKQYKARDIQGLMSLSYQEQLLEQQNEAKFYPCEQSQGKVKPGGWKGGHALNGIDWFCPWQKMKDNVEDSSTEEFHHKFISTFHEPESTLDVASSGSTFSNMGFLKNAKHHDKDESNAYFLCHSLQRSVRFYFTFINLFYYARSVFVNLQTH